MLVIGSSFVVKCILGYPSARLHSPLGAMHFLFAVPNPQSSAVAREFALAAMP